MDGLTLAQLIQSPSLARLSIEHPHGGMPALMPGHKPSIFGSRLLKGLAYFVQGEITSHAAWSDRR